MGFLNNCTLRRQPGFIFYEYVIYPSSFTSKREVASCLYSVPDLGSGGAVHTAFMRDRSWVERLLPGPGINKRNS